MNNCKGITADSIKADLKSGIKLSLISFTSGYLYDKIANKCKLKFRMRPDGGTLLHAMASGKFITDDNIDISTYFNNLIKYIEKSKRDEFIKILSQIDLDNLKAGEDKNTPLEVVINAEKNNNVKNKDTVLLFKKMLKDSFALRYKNKRNRNTTSTTSTSSLLNSKTSISSSSNNQSKKEITSVICSHESRIKCYLKKFGINDYTKDKVVKIEYYNDSVQKIKIGDSNNVYNNVYNKNIMKRINNNVKRISNNVKYIFYIFSCQTDDYAMNKINSDPRYNNVSRVNTNGLTPNSKGKIISRLDSIKSMLQKINQDYLFSSDLKRSMIDMKYMYQDKEIIVLPCCHPTSDGLNRCNGIRSSFKNTPGQNSLRNNIIWIYYEDFYGKDKRRTGKILSNNPNPTSGIFSRLYTMQLIKNPAFGRKHCSDTNFIDEAVEIIKKEKLAELSYNIKYQILHK
jgi:hypothetical protein